MPSVAEDEGQPCDDSYTMHCSGDALVFCSKGTVAVNNCAKVDGTTTCAELMITERLDRSYASHPKMVHWWRFKTNSFLTFTAAKPLIPKQVSVVINRLVSALSKNLMTDPSALLRTRLDAEFFVFLGHVFSREDVLCSNDETLFISN